MTSIAKIREERRKEFDIKFGYIEVGGGLGKENLNSSDILHFIFQTENMIIEEIVKWAEENKKEETDFRDNDYTRGMEAGKNYLIDDLLTFLKKSKEK